MRPKHQEREQLPVLELLGGLLGLAVLLGVADALLLVLRPGVAAPPPLTLLRVAYHIALVDGLAALTLALAGLLPLLGLSRVPGLLRRLPDLIFSALGLAAVAFVGFVLIRQPTWEAVDFRLQALAALLCAGLIGLRFALARPERERILPGPTALVGLAATVLTGAAVLVVHPTLEPAVQQALMADAITPKRVVRIARHLADRDRDGFPTLLCSRDCDCDDQDPRVNPAAFDVEGDGVDDDCDGSDGVAGPSGGLGARPAPSPEASTASAAATDAGSSPAAEPVSSGLGPDADPGATLRAPIEQDAGVEPDAASSGAFEGSLVPDAGALPPALAAAALQAAQELQERPPDILVVTIDTLRADRMSLYGYERKTTPLLDERAKHGVVFEQARTQGAMTRFSIPSFVTGRYHTELVRTGGKWPRIHPDNQPMALRFRELGYFTAVVSCFYYFKRSYGFVRGFDEVDLYPAIKRNPFHRHVTGDLVTQRAREMIARLPPDQPFLLWVHYGDPHSDYLRHEGTPDWGPMWTDLYDGEVHYSDRELDTLLDAFEASGRAGNAVVVLSSDHGEGLVRKEDHGHLFHGQHLFDNLIRVPLVFFGPGFVARKVPAPTAVGLIDVLPTLLELAGAPRDPALQGTSLVPYLRGQTPPRPPVFSEKPAEDEPQLKSMVSWPYKLIWDLGLNRFSLFDLEADPREKTDIFGQDRARDDVLVARLKEWRARTLKETPIRKHMERIN